MVAKKKARVRLTHFEVRRGAAVRLRLSIADDAVAEVGDELGALFRAIAPSAVVHSIIPPDPPANFVISPEHEHEHDGSYHEVIRTHFAEIFGALCDTALVDVLKIAREEHARRECVN